MSDATSTSTADCSAENFAHRTRSSTCVAERRSWEFCNPSRVRTHAHTLAEIESSSARVLYMAEMRVASDDSAAYWCAPQTTGPLLSRLRPLFVHEPNRVFRTPLRPLNPYGIVTDCEMGRYKWRNMSMPKLPTRADTTSVTTDSIICRGVWRLLNPGARSVKRPLRSRFAMPEARDWRFGRSMPPQGGPRHDPSRLQESPSR